MDDLTPRPDATRVAELTSRPTVPQRHEVALCDMRFAMGLSPAFGVLMLVAKMAAYLMTGSAAILSDAAESVIHVVAVAFAVFSLRLSMKPAAPEFLYGYERITFFSAGFEGAMIVLAAIFILYAAIQKWMSGLKLENLGTGTLVVPGGGCPQRRIGLVLDTNGAAWPVAHSRSERQARAHRQLDKPRSSGWADGQTRKYHRPSNGNQAYFPCRRSTPAADSTRQPCTSSDVYGLTSGWPLCASSTSRHSSGRGAWPKLPIPRKC